MSISTNYGLLKKENDKIKKAFKDFLQECEDKFNQAVLNGDDHEHMLDIIFELKEEFFEEENSCKKQASQ